jgi:hypothetical protein
MIAAHGFKIIKIITDTHRRQEQVNFRGALASRAPQYSTQISLHNPTGSATP